VRMDAAMKILFRLFRRSAAIVLLVGCGAFAGAQEKPKEADVIYPRNAAGANAPAAAGREGGGNTMLIGLAVLAAGVGGWLLWRQKNSPAGLGAKGQKLAIAETRSLGNRQYLVVADYDGRKFLLGVCPGRIEMLTPLGAGDDDVEAT
jgi:flagellar protein FliO/FliZ